MKPYSESCDQNRDPILAVVRTLFAQAKMVLEIGSGTGQHAVYFGAQLPHLTWLPSDRRENLDGIRSWVDEAGLPNVPSPLELDVSRHEWPQQPIDTVFSANSAHIMHWPEVEAMFTLIGNNLPGLGCFALYGPFNYHGRYTSESNARFDAWLKQRDPQSGIRNFQDLERLGRDVGLAVHRDVPMPANNRILCWKRTEAAP